ncbi:hypothetical protein LshimejAT787_1900890 [Lyophyllum shimeji]|uniref:Uncharacterized protein n=1 Tax=Lyophyllum shimeji TaxID=47721 RepID=A0A9P3UWE3_LYOSH|nr:hypothetical protein LshimejAT787_1900890 [Lyophyllum shimeji]
MITASLRPTAIMKSHKYHYSLKLFKEDPLVEYEFEEIKAAIAFDREVAANVGWLSLIKSPGDRKRMRIILALAFFSQWSGNGLVPQQGFRRHRDCGPNHPTSDCSPSLLALHLHRIHADFSGTISSVFATPIFDLYPWNGPLLDAPNHLLLVVLPAS